MVEAKWNAFGDVFVKVDDKIVGRRATTIMRKEPSDTIQVGADTGKPIGDYSVPNYFKGEILNLAFKYPNGT